MKPRETGIVADGRERLVRALRQERRAEIEREITATYEEALAGAGWLRTLLLRARIRREVAERVELEVEREAEKIAPRDGFYLKS